VQMRENGAARLAQRVVGSLGPRVAVGDGEETCLSGQRFHRAQNERVLDPEDAGKAAAVLREPEVEAGKDTGLQGREGRLQGSHRIGDRQEGLGVCRRLAHAAIGARRETRTDFDVGVSLSSPKVESGTSTLSSG